MAKNLLTAAEMQELDRYTIEELKIPGMELMERAGNAVAQAILQDPAKNHIGILCGKGNNAGDGLVTARYLAESGRNVTVLLLAELASLSDACRANLERLPPSVLLVTKDRARDAAEIFADCDILIDAILGIGIQGPVRGTFSEAIALINALNKPIIAIDIPSGLNADTGSADGACVRAHKTIAIGYPKRGMVLGEGPDVCGTIEIAQIGFPEVSLLHPNAKTYLLEARDLGNALPKRPWNGHKGTFGSLLIIAGGKGYSGAAFLAAASALRSGCGMVYAAFPTNVSKATEMAVPEAIKIPLPETSSGFLTYEAWDALEPVLEKADAITIGPGLGVHAETKRLVDEIVCLDKPILIDADALNCLGEKVAYLSKRPAPTVITPHPGEMARITSESISQIESNRIAAALSLAQKAEIVVLLKGARTVIAEPNGAVYINATGNAGLAKGGSGDLLAGLIGGLLAQGCSALWAACAGAYLHGRAGDLTKSELGEHGMTPSDVLTRIPKAFLINAQDQ